MICLRLLLVVLGWVSEYELVNWTRPTGDNKDRILRVFPPDEPEYQENAYNLVLR